MLARITKLSRMNFFQIVKFGMEIFEILHKCCCNTKFLQEIAFFHLVSFFFKFLFDTFGSISSIYKSFEQIHCYCSFKSCDGNKAQTSCLRLKLEMLD